MHGHGLHTWFVFLFGSITLFHPCVRFGHRQIYYLYLYSHFFPAQSQRVIYGYDLTIRIRVRTVGSKEYVVAYGGGTSGRNASVSLFFGQIDQGCA